MRRLALLGLVLLLPGCTGLGDFLGDTFTYDTNPNAPVGDSENMRRARGVDSAVEPLLTEPGDIWPGPVAAMPTLQDLEKNGFQPTPNGQPYAPDHREPTPSMPAPPSVTNEPPAPSRPGRVVNTPSGPGVTSGGTSGYQTLTTPQGQAVIVPNGNGTSTVIHSDGRVETIPTPK